MARRKRTYNRHRLLIATWRKAWLYSPERREALEGAKTGPDDYTCASCGKTFHRKEIAVDHIEPVIAVGGFVDWNTYHDRLFVPPDRLQVLCKETCHREKSKAENSRRKRKAK